MCSRDYDSIDYTFIVKERYFYINTIYYIVFLFLFSNITKEKATKDTQVTSLTLIPLHTPSSYCYFKMELLTEEEISEFREIFNLVDKDGGGSITGEELGELMDTLGIEASPEEIDAMIREVNH